jgi:protein-L-isoaspartate(D-aspartate) O-methyltransferase
MQGYRRLIPFIVCSLLAAPVTAQSLRDYDRLREKMVQEAVIGAGVKDPRVLQAIRETPRHEFVAFEWRKLAYFDMALPIGDRQTISSPFIVAYMTESLDPQPTDKVLEIGTGSGYQAAVLSPLVSEVYSIEIVEALGKKAARTLDRLGYENVHTKVGDGFKGWEEHAPFDKIIVTCSPENVPRPLVEQLREGGLMVIPVGERYQQTLTLMRKTDGKLQSESLRPTLFVPMTGVAESQREVQPDPANPQVVNGGFEEPPGEDGFISGWYYQRQVTWESAAEAPEGGHYITIRNETPGRAGWLLQGLPIDGRRVAAVELSAWVRCERVQAGRSRDEQPFVGLTFYDQDRKDLGLGFIGPLLGSRDWYRVKKTIRIPSEAREGLVRVGLFGAVGEISFDAVQLKVTPR